MTFRIYDKPTNQEAQALQTMRDWVHTQAAPNETITVAGKLDLIQRVLKEGCITSRDTWKLSALGLMFGDALLQAMEGRLRWVVVEDKLGISQALQWKDSDVLIYPLSALREPIQAGEALDIKQLYAEFTGLLPFAPR